jgi:hypothetical protein
MHITARLPILIGAGLLSAAIGAGPAQAAGSSSGGPQPPHHGQGDLIGYFTDRDDCQWAGRQGDLQNRWDDPHCDTVDRGQFASLWRLTADRQDGHDNGMPGHGHGNGNGHGHGNDNHGHGNGPQGGQPNH